MPGIAAKAAGANNVGAAGREQVGGGVGVGGGGGGSHGFPQHTLFPPRLWQLKPLAQSEPDGLHPASHHPPPLGGVGVAPGTGVGVGPPRPQVAGLQALKNLQTDCWLGSGLQLGTSLLEQTPVVVRQVVVSQGTVLCLRMDVPHVAILVLGSTEAV